VPEPSLSATQKPPLKERFQAFLAEYGMMALWVYFGIFVLVLVGFAVAITFGFEVESAAGTAGTWAAAYIATKLTQPFRILATFALTPLAVRVERWFKSRGPQKPKTGPSSRY
jgi:hypothetical protein